MNSVRFNYDRKLGPTSRPSSERHPKSIRISRVGSFPRRDSTGPGRNKIVAIVVPAMSSDAGSKTTRHILIFDNHPDSLRLVFSGAPNSEIDLSRPPPATVAVSDPFGGCDIELADRDVPTTRLKKIPGLELVTGA